MNCDICGDIFTKFSELKRHATFEKHAGFNFSCLPCSLPLYNISDVVEHVESVEHSIISLAADNPFDTLAENRDSESFPPLYFCLLCGCRDNSPYGVHLKSIIHKKMARLLRTILQKKIIYYTNDGCDDDLFRKLRNPNGPVICELCNSWSSNWNNYKRHLSNEIHQKTQIFLNKLINAKHSNQAHACEGFCYSFSFACGLCNIHFNSHESYEYHLENKTHRRVERFLFKIKTMVRNMDIIDRAVDLEITETFSNSLPPLYYCELCALFSFETSDYVRHSKGFTHKRIKELFKKLSDKRKGEIIHLRLPKQDSTEISDHYCKLCIVGFPDASDYELHLNDKGHLKIEQFINSLTIEEDVNFIKNYVDAQIQMVCGSSPPNYCSSCNILHSNSENNDQHLATKEHKQSEQNHLKNSNSSSDENPPKRLKKSPSLSNSSTLKTVQDNSVINKSDILPARETHGNTEQLKDNTSNETPTVEGSISSRPGFVTHEVTNHPPLIHFDAPFPGYPYHAPYPNYSPMPCFQIQEPYGYYPLPTFPVYVTNTGYPPRFHFPNNVCCGNYPPWPGFQGHASSNFSQNPLWPGFNSHTYTANSHNSSEIRIQPPRMGIENNKESIIYPPGTEILKNKSSYPHQQDLEISSTPTNDTEAPEISYDLPADEHYCELCSYSCSNSRLYEKHLKGDKHKKLMKLLNRKSKRVGSEQQVSDNASHPLQYNCELCDVLCTNASQYESHLATPKHKRNQWLLYVLIQKNL